MKWNCYKNPPCRVLYHISHTDPLYCTSDVGSLIAATYWRVLMASALTFQTPFTDPVMFSITMPNAVWLMLGYVGLNRWVRTHTLKPSQTFHSHSWTHLFPVSNRKMTTEKPLWVVTEVSAFKDVGRSVAQGAFEGQGVFTHGTAVTYDSVHAQLQSYPPHSLTDTHTTLPLNPPCPALWTYCPLFPQVPVPANQPATHRRPTGGGGCGYGAGSHHWALGSELSSLSGVAQATTHHWQMQKEKRENNER